MVPEGDDVIPLECSDEAEEQDTVRGLFGHASILPTLPHKDAGKCVCPPLGFEAKEGELVVGSLIEKSSPSPVAVQAQPEDPTSLQSEIQPQEIGRSSEPVTRHQEREINMATPLECQDNNQGVLVIGGACRGWECPVVPPPDDRHRELLPDAIYPNILDLCVVVRILSWFT
ncbi:hypothetical protein GBAR_LOCUS25541 [Geodia barretti]|uniref:Uncharacterized protein n=1 Tax=Geodia barretti TaxID=519541 RepID=A0AA35XBB8_GEOBA|nr:hypothetical protein GBAR_LOCUS25541 [Geodia barretti]